MKAGGGKEKGGQYERDICRQLSKWVTYGKRDDIFWRSASSGGRATLGLKQGRVRKAQVGDVSLIDPVGAALLSIYSVETKFYKAINFNDLLYGTKSGVASLWGKAFAEALGHRKHPFFIIKQNYKPALLCLDTMGVAPLIPEDLVRKSIMLAHFPQHHMEVYKFDVVLNEVDPIILT